MTDRKKTTKGLYVHCEGSIFDRCANCPYYDTNSDSFLCRDKLLIDSFAILKEDQKEFKSESARILKVVWDVLHSGVSTDTIADQDWVYEQIRNGVEKMY